MFFCAFEGAGNDKRELKKMVYAHSKFVELFFVQHVSPHTSTCTHTHSNPVLVTYSAASLILCLGLRRFGSEMQATYLSTSCGWGEEGEEGERGEGQWRWWGGVECGEKQRVE